MQKVVRDFAKQTHQSALAASKTGDGEAPRYVAPTWEKHLPAHASTVEDLEGACKLVETSMVVAYRAEDRRVKFLAFLFEAYEPRCVTMSG